MTTSTNRFSIYSASAGSGKTFMLTVEYLRFALKHPKVNYRKILAITFTNKATKEMKSRILEACEAFSQAEKISPAGRNKALWDRVIDRTGYSEEELIQRSVLLYTEILHNYSDFAVSTIDSFTQRIIRSFAYELKVPINFEVQLDLEETLRVISDRLIALVGKDDNITKLLEEIALNSLIDFDRFDISEVIFNAAKIIADESSPKYMQRLKDLPAETMANIGQLLAKRDRNLKREMSDAAQHSMDAIRSLDIPLNEYSGNYPFHNTYNKILSGLFDDKMVNKTFRQTISGEKSYFAKKNIRYNDDFDSVREEITYYGEKIIQVFDDWKITNFIYQNISKISVLSHLYRLYAEYQHEEDILLISEFNQLISKEVKQQPAPFIYEKIGEQYEFFLIDEFQDTSVMQFHNLLPLITHTLSTSEEAESLVVGDSKQAIYRFRGGETKQLNLLPNVINPDEEQILKEHEAILLQHAQKVNLPFNYRSKDVVVRFNNQLFNYIQEFPDLADACEIFSDSEQSIPDYNLNSGGYVEIKTYEPPSKSKNNEEEEEEFDNLERRLSDVHKTVVSALKRGYDYRDIAVLTRGHKESIMIAGYLANFDIPIVSSESMLLVNDISISLFPLIYAHILHPDNKIVQLEIATKLVWLKVLPLTIEEINNSVKEVKDFKAWLTKKSEFFDIDKIIDRSIMEGWELYTSWLPNENISPIHHGYFKEYLYDFSLNNGNDYDHFVLWWENKKSKLSIESTASYNGVQLMTIHKSKGLEFEIVIMPFADWKIMTKSDEWIDMDYDLIQPLNAIYSNIKDVDYLSDRYQEKRMMYTLDELNNLYVACTRAISELYIYIENIKEDKRGKILPVARQLKLTNFLINFLLSQGIISGSYISGSKTQKDGSINKEKQGLVLSPDHLNKTPIQIKERSSTIWNQDKKEKISRGNLIHHLMEKIATKQDIKREVEQVIRHGLIEPHMQDETISLIHEIVDHPKVQDFFLAAANVKAEATIIDQNGNTYIPDRLYIDNKNVKILDFKSGKKSSYHTKQLNTYAELLQKMGYSVSEKMLVYIDPLEIKVLND